MPDRTTFTIDGKQITVDAGKTVLEAALMNGIYIPYICYHRDLEPVAMCRLCVVDVGGRMVTSCNLPVQEGMVVSTETPEVKRVRKVALELLLANHQDSCRTCSSTSTCLLQRVSAFIGVDPARMARLRLNDRRLPIDDSNPFFTLDNNKCVLCGICIRTCDELQGANVLDYAGRGVDTRVAFSLGLRAIDSECMSCAECVVRCPVSALSLKNCEKPAREVKTICSYCGVGCGMYLGIRGNEIVSVRGDLQNRANRGSLCVKGRFGHSFVNKPDRLKVPLIKRNGKFEEASWDVALDYVAEKLSEYKGDSFALLSSAKTTNEDNYVIQKFARAVMGTNNIDHCARLCHAPTVAALAQSFGNGAMTNSIAEIENAACIFAIGTNTTEAHPVLALQVKKAVRKGGKLIVANPREINLCRLATVFLRQKPGSDVALLMGMMRVIFDEGLIDASFIEHRTEGFGAFNELLGSFGLEEAERLTGVDRDKIVEAARLYATAKPASILYAMGITQHTHGTDNVLAIGNLALMTGNLGKLSSGVNPLRGQNNVQGACDVGALPNVYTGYQRVDDPDVQTKFEKAWGCSLNGKIGLTHLEMFDAVFNGRIKAIYEVGENPILSEADAGHVERAIKKLQFFVVQDIFMTETAALADVVLPAATFAEKDGTFTNTERRVQRVRKAIQPIGQSKPDWWIACELAKRMGGEGFEYDDPKQIMDEIASLTPSYRGISFERIDEQGIQWPCPAIDHPGTPMLHTERFATRSGKGKFVPLTYRPPAETPDDKYPLVLTTGRSLFHYHTSTMTGRVDGLNVLRGSELVEMNPVDAAALGITDGDTVRVVSRRGSVKSKAMVTDASPRGVIFMTFHFADAPTNRVTSAALDPVAKIPETKVAAVRVEKVSD